MALGWPLQIQRGRQIWTVRYLKVHGRGCKEQNRESKGRIWTVRCDESQTTLLSRAESEREDLGVGWICVSISETFD